jgi:hypothetical protein
MKRKKGQTNLDTQPLGQAQSYFVTTKPQPLALGNHVLDFSSVEVDKRHSSDLISTSLGVDLRQADGVVHLGRNVVLERGEGGVERNTPTLGTGVGRFIALEHVVGETVTTERLSKCKTGDATADLMGFGLVKIRHAHVHVCSRAW